MQCLVSLFLYLINAGGEKMQQLVAFLPVLIMLAFPLLYFGGHAGSSICSIAGILVLFLGMSGPLIKRML